mmetsp:Transcript_36671/g.103456  ORF Transcript_36671/g.103456 Transcript_36671/m.103456 type:complete len:239 (+) Transcript_36671:386-1102(+)
MNSNPSSSLTTVWASSAEVRNTCAMAVSCIEPWRKILTLSTSWPPASMADEMSMAVACCGRPRISTSVSSESSFELSRVRFGGRGKFTDSCLLHTCFPSSCWMAFSASSGVLMMTKQLRFREAGSIATSSTVPKGSRRSRTLYSSMLTSNPEMYTERRSCLALERSEKPETMPTFFPTSFLMLHTSLNDVPVESSTGKLSQTCAALVACSAVTKLTKAARAGCPGRGGRWFTPSTSPW